ncbi:MAG TPA: winged helix-turn-helix transcriptional regulator [Anaerolineae bacterium]|nr:winged helix-turn-helix transcriptional regulator [Anaerolineae bacterium]
MAENKRMQDIRNAILNLLRERGQATAVEIADAVGMSPVNAHYHLGRLEREGLVVVEPLRQGVGRPKYLYSLAGAALEQFPQSTHRLADRLLDALQAQLTPQQIEAVFNRIVADIATERGADFKDKSLEDKIEVLVGLLGEEGFFSRVEKVGQDFQLTQCGCPYQYVVERHPSICAIDLQLINATLGTPVERGSWILNGDHVCTFHVKVNADHVNA